MDFEDIKWWFEDNWKLLVSILVVLGLIGGGAGIFYLEADRNGNLPDTLGEQVTTLQTNSDEVKEAFSLLNQVDTSSFEGQSVYVIDLYNKKPFIESSDLEQLLQKYVEAIQIVDNNNDKEVRAIQFNLYDRKIKYDIGANPDGSYYYAIPYSSMPEADKEDAEGRYYNMSPEQVAFEYTSLYAPEKIDDKKLPRSVFGNYQELKRKAGVEPMSDQEYNWFVKLDTYTALGGDSGILYLQWELGAPESGAISRLFMQDVRAFRKRLTQLGDDSTLYGNDGITERKLKSELVIENPSFLYFAETGKLEEDAIEARALLVEEFPEKYEKVVSDWVQSLAEEQVQMINEGTDPATSEDTEEYNDLSENSGDSATVGTTDTDDTNNTTTNTQEASDADKDADLSGNIDAESGEEASEE